MRKLKRFLSAFLVVLMVLTSAPLGGFVGLELPDWFAVEAEAASDEYLMSGYCGEVTEESDGTNLSWVLDDEGTLAITGTGRMAKEAFIYDLRIKSVVIGEGVENIGAYAFNDCSNITSVSFSDTVTAIDNNAFYDCVSLTEVDLPDSLVTLGAESFGYCDSLISVTFNSPVKIIRHGAFRLCHKLAEVTFFEGVEIIESYAFYGSALKSLTLPETLKEINARAFYGNNLSSEIVIPDSVVEVAGTAFQKNKNLPSIYLGSGVKKFERSTVADCPKLSAVNVSEYNQTYSSYSGILYNKAATEIIYVPAAVSGEITLPKTIEKFSADSVGECGNLTGIHVEAGNEHFASIDGIVYSADKKTLIRCPEGRTGLVTIPEGTEKVGDSAFYVCENITDVEFPSSLTAIGRRAFADCFIKKIVFNEGLLTIDSQAFSSCDYLKEIILPNTLKTISYEAFYGCNLTGHLIIPDSVVTIALRAFSCNGTYDSVHIGSGAMSIDAGAFEGSSTWFTFESFTVSADNQSYAAYDGVLYNKALTEIITVPNGIKGEIELPKTVKTFEPQCVVRCPQLTNIKVEEGSEYFSSIDGIVYSADKKTLIRCPRGKSGIVTVAENTETIGAKAFYDCRNITEVILPDSIKTIEDEGFRYCTMMSKIVLPESLQTIGKSGFLGCSNLETINIPPVITEIKNSVFSEIGFTELLLPETVQIFDHLFARKLEVLTINNKYCRYTKIDAPIIPADCTVRAYCGSPGHELAVKRLLNFESLGHTYLNWYVVTPATYESEGLERRDCAYCDGVEERPIPKLEKDVYTASFVANGEVVATVDFAKGATEIEEPAVPQKDRYIGEWEEYTLSDSDITINAKYTLIKSGDASQIETESEIIHYTDADDVLFRFKAWADAAVVKSTVSQSVPLDIVLVVDQSGSMDETLGGNTKKIDALKDTAKDFVNTVYENAKMTGADHRISFVGFGLSGDYNGYEKNENTELLTSQRGIVKFENIKTSDYGSSLLSVNVDGEVNTDLITAIDSIEARGATAADLGFEMAKGIFANTDSTDRQRVVVFMTDGEPTYLSGFQTSVANSAIANASTLKKTYNASIYSVGVFSEQDSKNTSIKNFMNAVSSGYPEAVSMNYMGEGTDGEYYITVNNTDSLTSVFKSISTESLSHTAPFDNLTLIKTLSKYVTLTSQQEQQLRIDLIRQYGITNDDIIVTRNADGTTTIQLNGLTPEKVVDEEGNITYEVHVEFFASLNEKAATAGAYVVDTEDSGVMLGEDAKGYEATFETSTVTLSSEKTRVIFTLNGEVYEVSENIKNGYAVAPELEVSEDWNFKNWNTSSQAASNGMIFDATLVKAERTITWHTAQGDIVQTYVEGDFIVSPTVEFNENGDTFLSWDKSTPTTMPDENLEFTAVYGIHVHNYTSEITKEMTCVSDGVRTYTCICGDTYDEAIATTGHNYEAITPSLEKDDAKCTFVCTNCGDKYDYALDYEVVSASGNRYNVLYEFQLTDDNLDYGFQPDGEIQIRIPLSELHGRARNVKVVRTNDDGSKTAVPAKIENGFLVITCDHFTPYEVNFDVECEEHVQGEWVVTKKASCTQEGSMQAKCTICEEVIATQTIDKTAHKFGAWSDYVKNNQTGRYVSTRRCADCGTVQTRSYIGGNVITIDELIERLFNNLFESIQRMLRSLFPF